MLLTEAVVALAIMLLGLVAVVRLMGETQQPAAAASAETTSALFADAVLEGLRAQSYRAAESNAWADFWQDLASGAREVPLPTRDVWANATSLVVRAGASNEVELRIFEWHRLNPTTRPAATLRYALRVSPPAASWNTTASVELDVAVGDRPDAHRFRTDYVKPGPL